MHLPPALALPPPALSLFSVVAVTLLLLLLLENLKLKALRDLGATSPIECGERVGISKKDLIILEKDYCSV